MESIHYQGAPKVINGDRVIGFTHSKKVKDMGYMDRATLAQWYREDPTKNHLGLVNLFSNFASIQVPILRDLFKNKAVMELNGMDGSFTYDLPVYKPTGTWTMQDTSMETEYPGIEETEFPIVLSKPYQPGDVLTYDKQYGEQLIITTEQEVLVEGENYLHYAKVVTSDKRKYFPSDKLKAGIQYFKIGHQIAGEFGVNYSNIESPDNMGTMKVQFVLGNHRGVQTFYTMYADKKSYSGAATESKNIWNKLIAEQGKIKDAEGRELDMMFVGNIDKATGQISKSSLRFGATLEYLTMVENIKLESNQLLFQKGAEMKVGNGFVRLNEGAFHQIRRGKKISYTRPGGMTREHIKQAAAYVFQGREDLLPHQRYIKFRAGWGAYQNIINIFREEFHSQLAGLGTLFMGTDRTIPNPVSGPLDGLKLAPVMISSVAIPDIGMVEIEYDPSLNFTVGADRTSSGFVGQGHKSDSYSAIIWDASDSSVSNARANLPSNVKLIDGGNNDSNVYYVKPEGESMWWGYEQGRWAPNKTSDIVSSSKTMAREFWVHSSSACWIRDTTRFIVIELKK